MVSFFNTSFDPEMSTIITELDGSWIVHTIECPDLIPTRSFVCVKCGAENVEVPCPANIKKCAQCGNTKRNIDLGDDIYDHQSPDYLTLDSDESSETEDSRYNFKEMVKHNTSNHSARLGSMEGDIVEVPSVCKNRKVISPAKLHPNYTVLERFMPTRFALKKIIKTDVEIGKPVNTRAPCVHPWHQDRIILQPMDPIKPMTPSEALVKDKLILKNIFEQIKVIPETGDVEFINMIKNKIRSSLRAVQLITDTLPSESNEQPKFGNQKYVFDQGQINTWKLIVRETAQRLQPYITYEFNPEEIPVSPKQFSEWTWKHFMGARTPEEKANKVGYSYMLNKMNDAELVKTFMAITPVPAPTSDLIREYNLEGLGMVDEHGRQIKREIVMSDPSFYKIKKVVKGDEISMLIDPSIAKFDRKDWLALRGTIGVEVWHNENYKPKFSYQAFVFKIARRLRRERSYFNGRTAEWTQVLQDEAYISTTETTIDIYAIYKQVQERMLNATA